MTQYFFSGESPVPLVSTTPRGDVEMETQAFQAALAGDPAADRIVSYLDSADLVAMRMVCQSLDAACQRVLAARYAGGGGSS